MHYDECFIFFCDIRRTNSKHNITDTNIIIVEQFVCPVYPFFRLSAYISASRTERISVEFYIGNFYENLSRKFKFS